MSKNKYILQTPIQFSFDIPALNITLLNVPHEVSLTDQEVLILRQGIPNIKIVPSQPTVPSTPTKAKEVKQEVETPVEVKEETVEQTIEVTTTITQDIPVSEVNPDGVTPVKSAYLSVTEASVIIKNAKSKTELEGFLSEGESRKGILDEYNKRLKELN